MAAVRQDLTVAIKLNDQFSGKLGDIRRDTDRTFGNKKGGLVDLGLNAKTALLGVGTALVGGAGAVAAGLVAATQKSADFEAAMDRVSALAGTTLPADLAALEEQALKLSGSTMFKGTEVAEGMQALATAGMDVNGILESMPGLLDTAMAGNAGLQETADIITNIMSGFGIDPDETGRVADVLAATFTTSNTNLNMLGETMKFVAPLAATSGQNLEIMAAAAGILGNTGIQGSMAGTALRTMLTQLKAPTDAAQASLDELNIQLTNADGTLLELPDLVRNLQSGMARLDPSRQTRLMKDLVGTEAMTGLQVLLDAGPDKIREYANSLENSLGTSARIAKQSTDNLKGSWTTLGSAFDTMMIKLGMSVGPAFNNFVKTSMIPLVEKTTEFIEVGGGIGPMFDDALTSIKGFKNSAILVLDEFFANPDFRTQFLGNLGDTIVAALTAYGTYLLNLTSLTISVAKTLFVPYQTAWKLVWDWINPYTVGILNTIGENATAAFNGIIRGINDFSEHIGITIAEIDWTPLIETAPRTASEVWSEFKNDTKAAIDEVVDKATTLVTEVGEGSAEVAGEIKKTIDTIAPHASEELVEVKRKYDGTTRELAEESNAKGEAIGKALGEGVTDGFAPEVEVKIEVPDDPNSWRSMVDSLKGIPIASFFQEKFGSIFSEAGVVGQAMVQGMEGIIQGQSFGQAVAQAAQTIGMAIGGPLGSAIAVVSRGVLSALAPASLVERKKFEGYAEEVAFAVEMGGIGKLSMSTDKGRDLREEQRRYARGGRGTKQTLRRTFAEELQEQFGKDREGEFYLNPGRALSLAEALLTDQIYGEAGEPLTQIIRDVIISSTADELVEEEKRKRFKSMISDEAMSRAGITAAANGYSGMVSEPTLFLAGEAGPEMVDITPTSRMEGGFSGSGGANFHFNFSVNTIDEQGVKSFIEQDAKPFIVQMLNRESTRGSTVMYSTGLTTDPSV
jgi:TP901 family phage tail tape measure protein